LIHFYKSLQIELKMTEVSLNQNFDELFIAAEKQPAQAFIHLSLAGSYSGPVTRVSSQVNSRVGSQPTSRNSPARKPTVGTGGMCPSNPAVIGLRKQASRSHSMRDQTAHMREKFLSDRLSQRRQSTTKSPCRTPLKSESRNNSLQGEDIEVTRQFLATHSKVINRGDSFKRKNNSFNQKKRNAHCKQDIRRPPENEEPQLKSYRVAFLGASSVGKTSIIDQFMSSEHTDVYERNEQDDQNDIDIEIRTVSVDVNGEESKLDLIEPLCDNVRVNDVVEDQNPDCLVVVYSVDDSQSFSVAEEHLDWLTKNNYISTKPCILVGNKADLVRSRVLETNVGCDLAIKYAVKFTETSPGCGHHIDELLVGIVMQVRLNETGEKKSRTHHKTIKETMKGILSLVTGKEEEKRRHCRNLNIL